MKTVIVTLIEGTGMSSVLTWSPCWSFWPQAWSPPVAPRRPRPGPRRCHPLPRRLPA